MKASAPAPPRTTGSEAEQTPSRAAEPAPAQEAKAAQVQAMFSQIAWRYDLLNSLLSLGFDKRWRRAAARAAFAGGAQRVLDVATGTADLALELKRTRPSAAVVGVDFAEPMLAIGRRKAAQKGLAVTLEQGDGLNLPYPDASFDALTVAYGLRNFADVGRGLQEFYRVLRPGGRVVVLEFPPPPKGFLGRLFRFYFLHVLPRVGGWLSGQRRAYAYLPESVLQFPPPAELARLLEVTGFVGVRYWLQTFGVSALHTAEKPTLETTAAENPKGQTHPGQWPAGEKSGGEPYSARSHLKNPGRASPV